jgi:hypothetical protein
MLDEVVKLVLERKFLGGDPLDPPFYYVEYYRAVYRAVYREIYINIYIGVCISN